MKFLDTNVIVYSMLLAAAESLGCDEFWSEDLNDGQLYCGIKAINPFK